jgi:hypothetical protein
VLPPVHAGLAAGYALNGATEPAVAALGEARKLIAGLRKVRDGRGVTAAPRAFGLAPDGSRQKFVRFQQPDQFRGPFPSLLQLPGISQG